MRIFMVHQNPWKAGNPYISTLIEEIKRQHPNDIVSWGRDSFWSEDIFSYDIVHFHWPHAFMPKDIHSEEYLCEHIDRIRQHGVKIVATCHDIRPHYSQCSEFAGSLNIVYSHCDAIFHFGEYSKAMFEEFYPNIKHYILPHHFYDTIYSLFPTKEESLRYLKLPFDRTYILCFGTFRADVERNLVVSVCRQLRRDNVSVLAPGFMDITGSRNSLRGFYQRLKRKYYQYRYHIYCVGKTFAPISDEDLPYYYGAADLAFVQRVNILNSGNIYMPILFGKIVVGPDTGNVGPILREWGLPVFDVHSLDNVGCVIKDGLTMARNGYCKMLTKDLLDKYSTRRITELLYNLYNDIIQSR